MEELLAAGGGACATDQVLYNLSRRGREHDLLLWLEDHAMPVMAYSTIEQGRLVADTALAERRSPSAQRALRSPWPGRCDAAA